MFYENFFWVKTQRNIVKEGIKMHVIDSKSRGYSITGIQLQKVQIRHLYLDTHVIMRWLCNK